MLRADRSRIPEPGSPFRFTQLPIGTCRILPLASLAPSGHNTQPWAVRHFYNSAGVLEPSFRQRELTKTVAQTVTHGRWLIIPSPGQSMPALLDTGRRMKRK